MNLNKNIYIMILAWWVLWTTLHVWMLRSYGFPFEIAITDGLVANVLLGLFCAGTSYSIRYYRPEPEKSLYLFLGIITFSALITWITIQIMQQLYPQDDIYNYFLKHSDVPRFIIALLMLALSVTFGWVFHFQSGMKEEKLRSVSVSKLAKDAELANLIQKIQPHFLFNTLNSVNMLVQSDPDAAQKMIQQLSDFLRVSLNNDKKEFTSIEDELAQIELYFSIEKIRFGNRLSTEIHIQEEALKKTMPPLLLQPLVENAIKFGLYDTLGKVVIKLNVAYQKPYLEIKVTNPYDEQSGKMPSGTGFGLSSLRKRLNLIYGRNDLFEARMEYGEFVATLKIPVT